MDFFDIVSFFEFHGEHNYTEKNTTWQNTYLPPKIGYAYICGAVVALYFHNVLPCPFVHNPDGKSSSSEVDLFSHPELPGLPHYRKWDNHDGATGRKY